MRRPHANPPAALLIGLLLLFAFAADAGASVLLWYRFDDGTGATVTDASGNGNNLSANAAGFLWNQKAGAPFAGSIHFNGNGSALAQKNAVSVQPQTIDYLRARSASKVTIAFWANPDTQGQATAPFGFLKAGPGRVFQSHLLWTNANVYWDVGYTGAAGDTFYRTNAATTSAPGAWTHWAFVYDGALTTQTLKVYRNNVLLVSGNVASPQPLNWAGIDSAAPSASCGIVSW